MDFVWFFQPIFPVGKMSIESRGTISWKELHVRNGKFAEFCFSRKSESSTRVSSGVLGGDDVAAQRRVSYGHPWAGLLRTFSGGCGVHSSGVGRAGLSVRRDRAGEHFRLGVSGGELQSIHERRRPRD